MDILSKIFIIASGFFYLFTQNCLAQKDSANIWMRQIFDVISNQEMADSLARASLRKNLEAGYQKGVIISTSLIGEVFQHHAAWDSAIYYFREQLTLASEAADSQEVAFCLLALAENYRSKDEFDTVVNLLDKSLELYNILGDTGGIAFTLLKFGHFYNHDKEDLETAITHYLKAKKIFEAINDRRNIARTNQGIGIVYNKQNDTDQSRTYFSTALEMFEALKDTAGIIEVHNDFGILNRKIKNYKQSEQHYLKILALGEASGFRRLDGIAHANLANLMQEIGRYEEGLKYSKLSIDSWDTLDVKGLSGQYNYLAKNLLGLGRIDQALTEANRSLQYAEKVQSPLRQRDALLTLATIHDIREEYGLAYNYFNLHKIYYDSLFNAEKTEIIHELETKYETQKKEAAIELLQKNAELDVVQKRSLLIGLALLSLTALFIIYALSLKRTKDKKIHEHAQEVADHRRRNLELELEHKKKELLAKVLQLAKKNEFLVQLEGEVSALKSNVDQTIGKTTQRIQRMIAYDRVDEEEWSQFAEEFQAVHQEFIEKLYKKYGTFTHSEMRLITLLKMNLSSKEIANILRISDQSIWKSRYRLRKKMKLAADQDLQALLLSM